MESIISQNNGKVRTVVRLLSGPKERKYLGRYVVEGTRMVREIPDKDLDSIFMTQAYLDKTMKEDPRIRNLVEKAVLRGRCYVVTDIILRKMSDTKHPQGIVATVNTKDYTVEDLMMSGEKTPLIVVLERIQDPGNMGTIIRSAEAAGATGILVSYDSVDIYSPKVVRATMGSIFRMKVASTFDLIGDLAKMKSEGIRLYGMHLNGSSIYQTDLRAPSAFLIGNEGAGLTNEVSRQVDGLLKIPMMGEVESLNAAASSTLIMYETMRQRFQEKYN